MARDNRYERWLTQEGVDWHFRPAVPVSGFDFRRSLRNQARVVPINTDVVDEYALAMIEIGTEGFPAVIAWPGTGGLVLITGNHRIAAAIRAEKTAFDCYVVETTDFQVLDRLTRSANVLEGIRLSRAESIVHAKSMVLIHKRSMKDAAAQFHLPVSTLQSELRVDEVRVRFEKGGIPSGTIPVGMIERMGAIPNDLALAATERARRHLRLNSDEISDLVKTVRAEHSEQAQLAAVAAFAQKPEFKDRPAQAGRARVVIAAKRARLRRLLGDLRSLLTENNTPEALQITSRGDINAVADEWTWIDQTMRGVLRRAHQAEAAIAGVRPQNGAASGNSDLPAGKLGVANVG